MTTKRTRKPAKTANDKTADTVLDAACKHAVALIRAGESPLPILVAAGVAAGVVMGAP